MDWTPQFRLEAYVISNLPSENQAWFITAICMEMKDISASSDCVSETWFSPAESKQLQGGEYNSWETFEPKTTALCLISFKKAKLRCQQIQQSSTDLHFQLPTLHSVSHKEVADVVQQPKKKHSYFICLVHLESHLTFLWILTVAWKWNPEGREQEGFLK